MITDKRRTQDGGLSEGGMEGRVRDGRGEAGGEGRAERTQGRELRVLCGKHGEGVVEGWKGGGRR